MLLVPDDCEGSSVNVSQSFSPWDPARNKDLLDVPQLQRVAERFASSAVEVVTTGIEVPVTHGSITIDSRSREAEPQGYINCLGQQMMRFLSS